LSHVHRSQFAWLLILGPMLLVGIAPGADSLNVRLMGSCRTPGLAMAVAVSGGYAFVADWSSGLRVISLSDPAHPAEVGHIDTPDSAERIAVSGNYAYMTCLGAGLRIISVADPTHPTEVGSYDTPGLSSGVAVDGSFAYVAGVDSGLWVISITDPAHPTVIGRWMESGTMTSSIAVAGHFVYVLDYSQGLRVISVADPAHPVEVGHNDSVGFLGVAVAGGHAYVGRSTAGLFVVSLADSTRPAEVGSCDTHQPIRSVAVDGYAYTIGGTWLDVFSVSDPAHPYGVGRYYRASWGARYLAASGDYIYVATDSGLSVCQRYGTGVEESTDAEPRATKCEPTVVRGVMFLPQAASLGPQAPSLLDATARKVRDLRRGANDVSGLVPGVYFVYSGPSAVSREPSSVIKVVITK
jgi:hypothetical protein